LKHRYLKLKINLLLLFGVSEGRLSSPCFSILTV
jgi:hypothetical protein